MAHMLPGEPATDAGDVLLSTADHKFVATRDTAEKVHAALGADPAATAGRIDSRKLMARLDECGVAYVIESPTQSIACAASEQLAEAVRAVVRPASSAVGDVSWDAPFPFRP